jgi:glycosyltransferase involved in cell wall biosynthesis
MSAARSRPRVVLLRGNYVNLWDLRSWELLSDEFDVAVLLPEDNLHDVSDLRIEQVPVSTVGARMPGGRVGALATRAVGQRYLGLEPLLRDADVVHPTDLVFWFSWQAAVLKRKLGYRLALTVAETLPFVDAYRNVRTRRYRRAVLAETDRFLTMTERARDALLLEGADPARIVVSAPGTSVERFAAGVEPAPPADGRHLLLSIGRLVWEKGHQDLLRAVALLRARGRDDMRVVIVGTGPEEKRLRGVIRDLGLEDVAELRGFVPHDDLPGLYAQASALVLASLAIPFWEEQFGLVLAEAMAAHVPVLAAASGAIPEVVGDSGTLFTPGDWVGLATALADGPLAEAPVARRAPEAERLARYSREAQAERLRTVYRELLG